VPHKRAPPPRAPRPTPFMFPNPSLQPWLALLPHVHLNTQGNITCRFAWYLHQTGTMPAEKSSRPHTKGAGRSYMLRYFCYVVTLKSSLNL